MVINLFYISHNITLYDRVLLYCTTGSKNHCPYENPLASPVSSLCFHCHPCTSPACHCSHLLFHLSLCIPLYIAPDIPCTTFDCVFLNIIFQLLKSHVLFLGRGTCELLELVSDYFVQWIKYVQNKTIF